MLPDIDLRLTNTIKALSDVVLPALPTGEALAREQAQLAIAHLGLVQQQWKAALAAIVADYRTEEPLPAALLTASLAWPCPRPFIWNAAGPKPRTMKFPFP